MRTPARMCSANAGVRARQPGFSVSLPIISDRKPT